MITAIDHIHVPARDLAESVKFYTDTLGFTLLRRLQVGPEGDGREMVYLELGGVLLELTSTNAGPSATIPSGNGPFGLVSDDLDTTLAELRARGVSVAWGPREANSFDGRLAAIADPSGMLIEIKEYRGDGPRNSGWQPSRPGVTRLG